MQNIQKAIENELRKTLGEYYNCACRAKVEHIVEEEFKYKCLREWIERELDMGEKLINVFCPADRDKNYTNEQVKIYLENMQKGIPCSLESITQELKKRDYIDSHRDFAPLVKADDAFSIDTSNMDIDEVVQEILNIIYQKVGRIYD